MPNIRTFKPSFSGGEISPEMFGRIDDAKYGNGAAVIENLIATPLGPAEKRPGFEFVANTKDNGIARLIPFVYSTSQTMVIELGAGYFRFYTDGEVLEYDPSQPAFKPSFIPAYTVSIPTTFTQTAHGLTNGESVVLAITGIPAPGNPIAYPTGLNYGPYTVDVIDANTFHLKNSAGVPAGVTALPDSRLGVAVQPNYQPGDMVTYSGAVYYRPDVPPSYIPLAGLGLDTNPATDGFWHALPADLTYEVANNYAVDDIFDIHYTQSNDVITLVHQNYPPSELSRHSASLWTFVAIDFVALLPPPTQVIVEPHPGFKAQIKAIATETPPARSLITTVSNHTLAMGDPVYLYALGSPFGSPPDGFYIVDEVPIDGSGNLIPDELYMSDLNGTPFSYSSTYGAGATLQYGSQIYNITNYYVVTAIASDSIQQSAISNEASALNNLNVTGSYNTILWVGVPNAFRYYIYKKLNGLYGYIGEVPADTLQFQDDNIAPDFSITPPTYDTVFGTPDDYPGAVGYFQQRRAFAGTLNKPQNLWMSKTGTESDFSYSLPVQDTDRIAIGIAARQSSTIRHIVPLNQLVLMTNQHEISVSPQNVDTITPSTIAARPQSYIGINMVQPTVVNNSLVFAANRGGHVREMGYRWELGGYLTGDISLRATHLFDNLEIVDQAYMKAPYQIVWFVSSNGNLLGLTYIPEEQIGAWHHHTTDGVFESVACVAEGIEDRLYAIVRRTVSHQTKRFIERMSTRNFDVLEDCFYVDAGGIFDGTNTTTTALSAVPYSGGDPSLAGTWDVNASAPVFDYPGQTDVGNVIVLIGSDGLTYGFKVVHAYSVQGVYTVPTSLIPAGIIFFDSPNWAWALATIGGIDWLEEKTVAILADGAVQAPRQVIGHTITLDRPATRVILGLPYTAAIETLPLVLQIDAMGQGRQKNINKVWVRVYRSSGISAGPSDGDLVEYRQRTLAPTASLRR